MFVRLWFSLCVCGEGEFYHLKYRCRRQIYLSTVGGLEVLDKGTREEDNGGRVVLSPGNGQTFPGSLAVTPFHTLYGSFGLGHGNC